MRETLSRTFFLSKTPRHNTRHPLRGGLGQWNLQCNWNEKGNEGERKENSVILVVREFLEQASTSEPGGHCYTRGETSG